MIITSASNAQIKMIRRLIKSARDRRDEGLYVVEGIRMVREIPPQDVSAVYISEPCRDKYESVRELFPKTEIVYVAEHLFAGMSDTDNPQGITALARMHDYALSDVIGDNPFVLIGETIQDPGNLGTMIRTAEGAGASGIVISSDSVDRFNPKVVRATMGSVFRVPVYVSSDLEQDIRTLKEQGIKIYGAHLSGSPFYGKDFTGSAGFLIGNEGNGLSERISALADELIRIPMMGNVESLNAAASTAVISYEVLRQRFFKK